MNITVGVDIDAVLRNWSKSFNKIYLEKFPQHSHLIKGEKEWIHLPEYNFENQSYNEFIKENSSKINLEAETLPNVIETMRWLKQISKSLNLDIVIVSKQVLPVEQQTTYEWLKNNQLNCDRNIFTETFEEKWNYVDILIDDSVAVLTTKPKNKVSIKVLMPYNETINSDVTINSFGSLTFPDILNAISKYKQC